jgi:hypothetical protein
MKIGKTTQLAFTIGICAVTMFAGVAGSAAPVAPSAITEASIAKDLAMLENRFFSRQYANDPSEKRVERLELLVFGATQDGDLSQRWSRLNKAIASRAAKPVIKSAPGAGPVQKEADSSTQYPVLNTLEWRALKQTFPKETLDGRLARLEKKLFGQDAPGMPYVDRVERLSKTLGIGVTAAVPTGPTGPAPKARPRNNGLEEYMYKGGGDHIYGDEGTIGPLPGIGFGFGGSPMNGAFAQLFADMNKQMAEMDRLGPGAWTLDPTTGMWVEQFSGKQVKPSEAAPRSQLPSPRILPKPTFPRRQMSPFNFGGPSNGTPGGLPPYTDPNSI